MTQVHHRYFHPDIPYGICVTAEGSAGGVGLANSCESALYWQHAGNELVWHNVYADHGVSELLRTPLKGHDLVQAGAVIQQVGMR